MTVPQSLYRYVMYAFRVFIISLSVFYACYFLGVLDIKGKQAFAIGIIGLGVIALWTAFFSYSKKPQIYRRGQKSIDFKTDPGNHNSSVIASVILGVFFIIVGAYGL